MKHPMDERRDCWLKIRVPFRLKQAVEVRAKSVQRTVSDWCRLAMEEALERASKKEAHPDI